MEKLYAIKRQSGKVGIAAVVVKSKSLEQIMIEIDSKYEAGDKIVSYREIAASDIPADRSFREAWTDDFDTPTVDVHMERAKDIHMSRIRAARDKKLSKLDIEQLKGNDVSAQKKALRDLPDTIDLDVSTPEELKSIWPQELE